MTPNDKFPEEMLRQIETEATVFVKGLSIEHSKAHQHAGYIAGATAWAPWKVRYDELRTVLQEFVSKHEAGLLPNRFVYEKAIKALNGNDRNRQNQDHGE